MRRRGGDRLASSSQHWSAAAVRLDADAELLRVRGRCYRLNGARESIRLRERLTLFSVAAQQQFLNHTDDRQRGHGTNPFGNFKAATATTKEPATGLSRRPGLYSSTSIRGPT